MDGELILSDQYNVNSDGYYTYIPKNTGILFEYTLEDGIFDGNVPFEYADDTNDYLNEVTDNMLVAASVPMTGNNLFYKLAYGDYDAKSGLGFYWGDAEGAAFTCKPGTAYLAVPKSLGSNLRGFVLGGDKLTGIKEATVNGQNTEIFNLQGQRISRLQQGVNIVNGKKVIR